MACVLAVSMTPSVGFADQTDADDQAGLEQTQTGTPAADDDNDASAAEGDQATFPSVDAPDAAPADDVSPAGAAEDDQASDVGDKAATEAPSNDAEEGLEVDSSAVEPDEADRQSAGDAEEQSVTCAIYGPDAGGATVAWAPEATFEVGPGATAADLTGRAIEGAGLTADVQDGQYGFFLNTITSPFDGSVLGWDETTGRYWQLFVNGEAASTGADGVVLKEGDAVTWVYSKYGDSVPAKLSVTCAIYGPDAGGATVAWAPEATFEVGPGATAADLTGRAIEGAGLTADVQDGQYGFFLNTITSPFDGSVLGWDETTGRYWQLFVNGEAASTGADGVVLKEGDAVAWSYSAWGDPAPGSAPDPDPDPDPDPNPDPGSSAPESEWPSFHQGSKNGAVVKGANTPTESAKKAWEYDPFDGQESPGGFIMRGLSDPLLVDGDVFVIGGASIYRLYASTGKVKASAETGLPAEFYFSRPAYADGLIYAAANDGRVAAFDVSTLKQVWCTDKLPLPGPNQKYQSLSSIVVNDGKVYAFFTVPEKIGTRVCLDAKTGHELWRETEEASNGAAAGYYWAGGCVSGTDLIIADDTGAIKLIDSDTGKAKATYALGSASRSGVIALDDVKENGDGTYLAVTRSDGTLHKIVRKGTKLTEAGTVKFAETSTSTPAVAGGKVFVCSCDKSFNGTLSVIDLKTMKVEKTVVADQGSAQGSPLVSVRSDGTYVYFTCNNATGGVYAYKLGADKAYMLYEPDKESQNYCTASVIADSAGNLYYANDTHKLVKLLGELGGNGGNDNGQGNNGGSGGNDNGGNSGDNSQNNNGSANNNDNSNDGGAIGNQNGNTSNKSGDGSGGTSSASSGSRSGAMMSVSSNAGSTRRSGSGLSGSAMSVNSNANGAKKTDDADSKGSKDGKEKGESENDGKVQASQAGNASAHGAVGSAQTADANRKLPLWPLVGVGLSALAIATLLSALYRRSGLRKE